MAPAAVSTTPRRRLPRLLLLPTLLICGLLPGCVQSVVWWRTMQTELASNTFGGLRLCTAPQASSVNITALDLYKVPALTPGYVISVRSPRTLYVSACTPPSSVDGTYFYLRLYLLESIQWDQICDNTRNLAISMGISGSAEGNYSTVRPCNYTTQHAGLTTEQVTAWILLTYSADWSPSWVNRTADYPDGEGAATVVLRGEAEPLLNATWRNVQAGGLIGQAAMTPAQQAQAVVASILRSQDLWLPICAVLRAPGNLLVSVTSNGVNMTSQEWHMSCSGARTTLVWGPPPPSAEAEAVPRVLASPSGGYWGSALRRLLATQAIGGVEFCNASTGGVQVTAVDNIVVSPAATVRGTVSFQVVPCSSSVSVALGDAYLKTLLRDEANWTEVCADAIGPTITVNLADRTAVQFSPCPQPEPTASVAAKAAWCILALNTSALELEWLSRDTVGVVEASAASVTFSVLGGAPNGTILQWGNVLVNGLTSGSQADRLVRAFQMADTAYWPVICQLVGASNDSFLSIEIAANDNSSSAVSLYANCSGGSELSVTPQPGNMTSAITGAATPTASTTAATPTTATTVGPPTATAESTTTTAAASPSPTVETSTTLSPEEQQRIVQQRNREELTAQKQKNELGTQIAVIMVALLVLVVLGTFGICKIVLPRNA